MREEKLSPKVKALYDAVIELIAADIDIKEMTVSDITGKAGIGKGTAYEYFSNKEEIISSALLYHIDRICSYVMEHLDEFADFKDMLHFILKCMDEEIVRSGCFIKFVHLLTDNGTVSRSLKKQIHESSKEGICMPDELIDRIITKGIEDGSIKSEFPRSYMKMALIAKLLSYAFYVSDGCMKKEYNQEQMQQMICDSLLKELN